MLALLRHHEHVVEWRAREKKLALCWFKATVELSKVRKIKAFPVWMWAGICIAMGLQIDVAQAV